jgi:uncharacterized RDD family membrane protein YckC
VTAPEKLTIETPEQIALEYALASIGSRFLAVAVDTLIQSGLLLVLGLVAIGVLAMTGFSSASAWVLAPLVLGAFLVYYGYFAAFEILWQGQTPGKRTVGLRVMDRSGRPITAYQSLLRNLVRIVDQMPGLYGVGILSVFITAHHQRLGDLAASTVVVHERPPEGTIGLAVAPSASVRSAVHGLTAQEISVIELFLERRAGLDVTARDQTARELANRVRRRLGLAAGGHDEDLLEQSVADYRSGSGYR